METNNKTFSYDVVLSHAGEDKGYAEALYKVLSSRGIRVFYDGSDQATLWGKHLYTYLSDLYQNEARYCVMFLSKNYATKFWTNHERKAALARAFRENKEYILPIRLDDTKIPGISSDTVYLYWPSETPETIAEKLLIKLNEISSTSKQGNADSIIQYLAEAELENNKNITEKVEYLLKKGREQYILQNYKEALNVYEQAIQLAPQYALSHTAKGQALYKLGSYKKSLAAYEKAILLDSRNAQSHRGKGKVLCDDNLYNEALVAFDQAIHLNPKDVSFLNDKGDVLYKLRRYEEALTIFKRVIRLDSKNVDAHIGKGNALRSLNQNDEALKAYTKAIKLDPSQAFAHHGKGCSLYELHLYEDALLALDYAISLNSKESSFYYNKGKILHELHLYADALLSFNEAIRLNKKNASVYRAKSTTLIWLKQYSEALEAAEKAIQVNPNQSSGYRAKAAALFLLNRSNESMMALKQATQSEADAPTYLAIGRALSDMGNFEDALSAYNQSIQLDPGNPVVHQYKAEALEKLGMFYEASRELEKAREASNN